MTDLELLELLEKAKTKQRGPKGETGVGIESVEQFDGQSFTLRLSDGSFKKIALQPGADGAVGPKGESGPKGEPGPAGRNGRDGSQGSPGRDGENGVPGVSTETAVVNSNGHLLLGLSDGAVIDVGRVVGPAGATGERGPTGLVGNDGRDGEAVLSGPRAPSQDDGKEGDMWIDISSAEFSFYKKNGEGWNKLAELRQVPRDLRVPTSGTGGGGGGGGNGELQNTRTLPLINGGSTLRKQAQARGLPPVPGQLNSQEDANLYFLNCLTTQDVTVSDSVPRPPYQTGQLWFCTNPEDLTLYVYDGAVWVPAAPPVSLDGIEASIANVDAELMKVNANIAMNKRDIDEAILDVREDQERQDGEIHDLHELVASIQEEFDRGKWTHVTEKPVVGQYALAKKVDSQYCQQEYLKCLEDAGDDAVAASKCLRGMEDCEQAATENPDHMVYVDTWGGVDHIAIHTEEADGETHGFGDYTVGKYIEITNEADEGNATYQITEDAKIENGVAIVKVSDIQATGTPKGLGRFKVFEMKSGDPTDYVQKSGDTMTGKLTIEKPIWIKPKDSPTGGWGNNSMLIVNQQGAATDSIVRIKQDGKDRLKVQYDGSTSLENNKLVKVAEPEADTDGANRKYVDDAIAEALRILQEPTPAQLSWEYKVPGSGKAPADGSFWLDGSHFRFSYKTWNGVNLGYAKPDVRDEWYAAGARDEKGAFDMTIWKKFNEGWYMYDHIECSATRWSITSDGVKHFEFKKKWSSHNQTLSTGNIYYITVGGFF